MNHLSISLDNFEGPNESKQSDPSFAHYIVSTIESKKHAKQGHQLLSSWRQGRNGKSQDDGSVNSMEIHFLPMYRKNHGNGECANGFTFLGIIGLAQKPRPRHQRRHLWRQTNQYLFILHGAKIIGEGTAVHQRFQIKAIIHARWSSPLHGLIDTVLAHPSIYTPKNASKCGLGCTE